MGYGRRVFPESATDASDKLLTAAGHGALPPSVLPTKAQLLMAGISPPRTAISPPRHISPGRALFASSLPEQRSRRARDSNDDEGLPRLAHRMGARRLRRYTNDHFLESVVKMPVNEVSSRSPAHNFS